MAGWTICLYAVKGTLDHIPASPLQSVKGRLDYKPAYLLHSVKGRLGMLPYPQLITIPTLPLTLHTPIHCKLYLILKYFA